MKDFLFFSAFSMFILLSGMLLAKACSLPRGFVYLADIEPSIQQKISFATDDNFLGTPADGYEAGRVICTKEAALALQKAQTEMKNLGLCLLVWDAYRPVRAVKHLQRWARDPKDQKTKQKYYPTISKEQLLEGFIASDRSSHSRGSTFDVIFIDEKANKEADFGPDSFGDDCGVDAKNLTEKQKANRLLLRKIMLKHGFKPYNKEFWHFTLKDEPFPETYFDFPIR